MRRTYIDTQRRDFGRKAVAVLPIHYPKELLTAMNLLAVEVWGPPGAPRGPAAGRIQPYVCAVVRNALAFMAAGGADAVEAMIFPHTCDSLQGLATLAPDFGGWKKPALRYIHPKGAARPSGRALVRAELHRLADALTAATGNTLNDDALRRAIALHLEVHTLRRQLLEERRRVRLSDPELYLLLRRGEYIWPEEHLQELKAAVAALASSPEDHQVPLMITGYVPEPRGFLAALNDVGACVVADDYAAVGRRVLRVPPPVAHDPWETLTSLAWAGPPCPTRGTPQRARLDYLEALFDHSRAAGLIIHCVKFCEPELFDVPPIRERFATRGVPVLILESELESGLSGQTLTRLEAFVEMVTTRRAP
jgi:benzoyl-CoA reductase/2-hydroxyglutaryl-CoA dehydratase subunit BcrC/BadD/HgdB